MERVAASCKKCNTILGNFMNLWTKIGKSYISPTVNIDDDLNIILTGSVRPGEARTLVDQCQLQDVACSQCRAIIGLKCLETPLNHVFHQDQLMLRLTSVVTTDLDGRTKAQLNIQRTLKLREAARNSHTLDDGVPSSRVAHPPGIVFDQNDGTPFVNDGIDISNIQADLDAQRQDIERIDSAGYQVVSAFDNAVLRIDGQVKLLKDDIGSMKNDIEVHRARSNVMQDDISSLRDEVKRVMESSRDTSRISKLEDKLEDKSSVLDQRIASVQRDIMGTLASSNEERQREHDATKLELGKACLEVKTLRKELEDTRSIARECVSMAKSYAKDFLSLRAEVKQLKEELTRDRSRKQTPSNDVFPTRELDILTSSITKIGNRASQVEGLQMEFQLLKGRVQRLEARGSTSTAENDGSGLRASEQESSMGGRHHFEPSRKRGPAGLRVEEVLDSASPFSTPSNKRHANNTWSSSPMAANYESASSPPSMASLGVSPNDAHGLRLTKSGAVDKRYLKRHLRNSTGKDGLPSG